MNRGLLHKIELLLLYGLCCVLVALLWAVRRAPLTPLPLLILDAPGAWFALVVCFGVAFTKQHYQFPLWHCLAIALFALLAALAAIPWIVVLLLLASTLLDWYTSTHHGAQQRYPRTVIEWVLRYPQCVSAIPALLSVLILAIRGVVRYDDPTAGAALDSLVFGFALLSAVLPFVSLLNRAADPPSPFGFLLRMFWLFPLMRLLLLSPWNTVWSISAALLGAGLALWASLVSLAHSDTYASQRAGQNLLPAIALTALGLASSAGVAACCFAILAVSVQTQRSASSHNAAEINRATGANTTAFELFPLGSTFVAAWLAIGAAAAAGSPMLAGVLWLAILLWGVALQIRANPLIAVRLDLRLVLMLAFGIAAPQIVYYGIQPVVEQLQGGLTAYGNLSAARWIGLEMADSASRVVITAPILAAAPLMAVLAAVCVLLARLWPKLSAGLNLDSEPALEQTELWHALTQEVPWLIQERNDADR